jgi:hypothetical protein
MEEATPVSADPAVRGGIVQVSGLGTAAGVVAQAGPVILGRPQAIECFPGDPAPGRTRLPRAPRALDPDHRTGVETEPLRPEEIVVEGALPEGPTKEPVKGHLYFEHRGAIKKINRSN